MKTAPHPTTLQEKDGAEETFLNMLNTVGPILIGMRPPIETHFLQAPSALAKISSTRVREGAAALSTTITFHPQHSLTHPPYPTTAIFFFLSRHADAHTPVAQHGGAGSLEGLCPKSIEFMVLEMYGGAGHDNGNDAARGEGKSKRIRKVA